MVYDKPKSKRCAKEKKIELICHQNEVHPNKQAFLASQINKTNSNMF